MDASSSWLPFLGGGFGDGVSKQATNLSRSSCGSEVQQKQEDLPITSQVEEQLHLQQFYMLMDMEKTGHPEPEVVPSSESSMFRSFFRSPDETSSLNPRSSNSDTTANKSCHHPAAEVSSQQIQLHSAPVTYYGGGDRHYDHQCYGNLDTILNQDKFNKCSQQEPHNEREQHNNGGRVGAFMPYACHLCPKKKPKPGSGGQRAIKAAISTLARMHMVRLAQWQFYQYQMEMALAVAPAPPTAGSSNCDQQQHVLSERKRREKLNDSFKALRTVLPPALKKEKDNKASILIRARDYVSTLESRVSELEEKNRMLLLELLQHRRNNGGDRGDVSRKKIKVDIDIDREAMPWML